MSRDGQEKIPPEEQTKPARAEDSDEVMARQTTWRRSRTHTTETMYKKEKKKGNAVILFRSRGTNSQRTAFDVRYHRCASDQGGIPRLPKGMAPRRDRARGAAISFRADRYQPRRPTRALNDVPLLLCRPAFFSFPQWPLRAQTESPARETRTQILQQRGSRPFPSAQVEGKRTEKEEKSSNGSNRTSGQKSMKAGPCIPTLVLSAFDRVSPKPFRDREKRWKGHSRCPRKRGRKRASRMAGWTP